MLMFTVMRIHSQQMLQPYQRNLLFKMKSSLYILSVIIGDSQNVPAKPQLNEDNQYKNWTELRQAAHGTQWADWDQYIGGVETEDQTIPLQNAFAVKEHGQMVNNKNNIEMIIGDRKVNTTLKYYSKEIRIGFVFESLENNSTDSYEIRIGNETPSIQDGMRLTFCSFRNRFGWTTSSQTI